MAEYNDIMPNEDMSDKKTAKRLAKMAKKEEKARKQEEKRRQKLEQAGATPEEIDRAMSYNAEYEEEGGNRLAVFFVTVVIIAVWLAILALVIKMDVGGFGSTVLHPLLKDVPYINRILPEVEEEIVASEVVNTEYPYATLEEAVARIKELEIALQNEKNAVADGQNQIAELQELAVQLETYKANEAAFEERKQKFDEEVVFAEQAPGIEEYKAYYESIDPANAEAIYKRVVEQQEYDKEVTEYVNIYSEMKPKQAAAIFDTMTKDLDLVAEILMAMDADSSSDILGAMDTETAAKLTKIMEPSE